MSMKLSDSSQSDSRKEGLFLSDIGKKDDVSKVIYDMLEATKQIRADVRQLKPDLTPTPEGQLICILPSFSSDQLCKINEIVEGVSDVESKSSKHGALPEKSFLETDSKKMLIEHETNIKAIDVYKTEEIHTHGKTSDDTEAVIDTKSESIFESIPIISPIKITPTDLSSSFTDVTSQVSVKSPSSDSSSDDFKDDGNTKLGTPSQKLIDRPTSPVAQEPSDMVEDIDVDSATRESLECKAMLHDEPRSYKRESLEDCITSEDVSQLSSLHISDSTKFSETDIEPVSSETDGSYKMQVESISEKQTFKPTSTGTEPQMVSPPHSECSESHIESIIDITEFDKKKIEADTMPSVSYKVTVGDIVMNDDVLEITVHRGDSDGEYKYIEKTPKSKTHKMKTQTTSVKRHTYVKRTSVEKQEVTTKITKVSSPSTRVRTIKLDSDADFSSDEDKIKEDKKTKLRTKSSIFASETNKRTESHIPKYTKKDPKGIKTEKKPKPTETPPPKSKLKSIKQGTESLDIKKRIVKRELSAEPKKTEIRVHGYMQSTLSRDLKIEKSTVQKRSKEMINIKLTGSPDKKKIKDKTETENLNEKTKQSKHLVDRLRTETKTETLQKRTYERQTISSENKVSSREGTPVKSLDKKISTTTPSKQSKQYTVKSATIETKSIGQSQLKADIKSAKMHISRTSRIEKAEVQYTTTTKTSKRATKTDISSVRRVSASQTKIKVSKEGTVITHGEIEAVSARKVKVTPQSSSKQIPPTPKHRRIAESEHVRRESPSPTKVRRATPVDQIKKDILEESPSIKPSDLDKTVQTSDRERSQSVISTSHSDKTVESQLLERTFTPSSLPGSPIRRVRSANGGTQVITSEVFKRTHDTGSIEVIYKQPFEHLKKVPSGIRAEGEISLIDTTDSSLSESVALPSSLSDHDMSSDANMRLKSTSPTSPKTKRSLESIHEIKHRVSDLVMYSDTTSELSPDSKQMIHQRISEEACVSLPRKLLMSHYKDDKTKVYQKEAQLQEAFLPMIDIQETSLKKEAAEMSKRHDKEEEKKSGNTTLVLPKTSPLPSCSMACRNATHDEVHEC